MTFECELKKGNTKDGKEYYYIFIEEIEKRVFLTPVELKLLKLISREK